MIIRRLHPWDVSPAEAVRLQEQLRGQVITGKHLGQVRAIAGADVYFRARVEQPGQDESGRAAVAVLGYPDLAPLEIALAEAPVRFPYIPGLLAFREAAVILAACRSRAAWRTWQRGESEILLVAGWHQTACSLPPFKKMGR